MIAEARYSIRQTISATAFRPRFCIVPSIPSDIDSCDRLDVAGYLSFTEFMGVYRPDTYITCQSQLDVMMQQIVSEIHECQLRISNRTDDQRTGK